MTDETITVVAGLGRCGTSLMMRMLRAGGMELFHDEGCDVSCETNLIFGLPRNGDFLRQCRGKAVKLLDPHMNFPVSGYSYRFIWIDRDPTEQAKSQLKLLQATRAIGEVNRQRIRAMTTLLRHDRTAAMQVCRIYGEVMRMDFEQILRSPALAAADVASFLTPRRLDQYAMTRMVIPRSAKCLPYMLELQQVSP